MILKFKIRTINWVFYLAIDWENVNQNLKNRRKDFNLMNFDSWY